MKSPLTPWPLNPPLSRMILSRLIPVTLGSLISLSLFSYMATKRHILENVDRELSIRAQNAASDLSIYFSQREEDTRMLSESVLLRDYIKYLSFHLKEEAAIYQSELNRYFARITKEKPMISRVSFVDMGNRELAFGSNGETAPPPPSKTFLPPRSLPIKEVRFSQLPRDSKHPLLFWIAVQDESGKQQGYLILSCRIDYLRERLSNFGLGEGRSAMLLDPKGQEVLASGPPIPNAMIFEQSISGTPWKIRLLAQPEEFLAPLRNTQKWSAAISMAAMLVVFLWIGYWVRRMTLPIVEMAQGTKQLAAGNLDFRFSPPPVQELKALGEAFNDMAAKLKDRNLQLEARIRQLTYLREMDGTTLNRLNEESVLRSCLQAAAGGLSLDRAALFWIDEARQEIAGRYLHCEKNASDTESSIASRRLPLGGEDAFNRIIATRAPEIVRPFPGGISKDDEAILPIPRPREYILSPICGKDRVFGILFADNFVTDRPLTHSDKEGLALFANAAGLALENIILFQHLTESEARHRAVVENSPTAVLGLSRELHITTWNHSAVQIFGYSAEEIFGKPATVLFADDAEKQYQDLFSEMLAKGSVKDFPMIGKDKQGRKLHLSLSWGGAHKDFRMNKEWALVIRDVTQSHRMQQQLIQSEKLSLVGQLISSIAHELNNPLQTVVGYAQLLHSQIKANPEKIIPPSVLREDLKEIHESALRCRKIIENLLFFVRQSGVEKEPLRIDQSIKASVDIFEYKLAKSESVKVDLAIPKALSRIQGNPQQIQQIFINLINNAIDAMSGQERPKCLWIRAEEKEDVVRVEVEDSGPGVPPEIQDRIFEPFFTTKSAGRGTGIGLGLCRQIIQEHGGDIGVSKGVQGGALFWIELPKATQQSAKGRKRIEKLPPIPGKRILLAEDEPSVRQLLKQALENDGDQVAAAASFAEAVAEASIQAFDLVVSDLRLGDSNGVKIYEDWQRHSNHQRPPFLFITGDVFNTSESQRLQSLAIPLLFKPIDLPSFQQVHRSLLAGKAIPGSPSA